MGDMSGNGPANRSLRSLPSTLSNLNIQASMIKMFARAKGEKGVKMNRLRIWLFKRKKGKKPPSVFHITGVLLLLIACIGHALGYVDESTQNSIVLLSFGAFLNDICERLRGEESR